MKKIHRITLEPTENGCMGTVHSEYDGTQNEHKYNLDPDVFNELTEKMGLNTKEEMEEQGAASPDVNANGIEKPRLMFDPKKYK